MKSRRGLVSNSSSSSFHFLTSGKPDVTGLARMLGRLVPRGLADSRDPDLLAKWAREFAEKGDPLGTLVEYKAEVVEAVRREVVEALEFWTASVCDRHQLVQEQPRTMPTDLGSIQEAAGLAGVYQFLLEELETVTTFDDLIERFPAPRADEGVVPESLMEAILLGTIAGRDGDLVTEIEVSSQPWDDGTPYVLSSPLYYAVEPLRLYALGKDLLWATYT
jgi:hypothetical protein